MKKLLFILIFCALFYGANAQSWNLTGNANTNPPTNYIGTSDSQPLIFKTNNTEHIRILPDGNIGIGTDQPIRKVHVMDGSIFISRKKNEFTEPFLEFRSLENEGGIWGGTPIGHMWSFYYVKEEVNKQKINLHGGLEISHRHLGAPYTTQSLLFLRDDGFVGINNTQPTTELDVGGDISAQNAFIFGSLNTGKLTTSSATIGTTTFLYSNIGVGTTNPQAKLDVNGSFKAQSANITGTLTTNALNSQSANIAGTLTVNALNSKSATISDTLTSKNANIDYLYAWRLHVTGWGLTTPYASIKDASINKLEIYHDSYYNGPIAAEINLDNSYSKALVVNYKKLNTPAQAVFSVTGDGTLNALSANINGKLKAKEIQVTLSGFPDYVFEKDYPLLPLSDLEQYIEQNQHLPNIPSAAEVEENGLDIGDMQSKLLQKIEELTLYILDLQKQIDELKK